MADQEFLAAFGVDIDESGVSRLQKIPEENRKLADSFLRRWARWARSAAKSDRIALGTLTILDSVSGFKTICTGMSLQKVHDRTFDRTGTNLAYTLLATTTTEQ